MKVLQVLSMDSFFAAVTLYELSFKLQPFLPPPVDIDIDGVFSRKV